MSGITTHVLDTSLGRPAHGVPVELARADGEQWTVLKQTVTNRDGRVADLTTSDTFTLGTYRLRFATAAYFAQRGQTTFYPQVDVLFTVEATDAHAHYHVPLLLSPFGYSTYRGS